MIEIPKAELERWRESIEQARGFGACMYIDEGQPACVGGQYIHSYFMERAGKERNPALLTRAHDRMYEADKVKISDDASNTFEVLHLFEDAATNQIGESLQGIWDNDSSWTTEADAREAMHFWLDEHVVGV